MRLIPSWFSDMLLGMALLYLPMTLLLFYVWGSKPLIDTGAGFTVDAWLSGCIIAVSGGLVYSLGALAFHWIWNLLKKCLGGIAGMLKLSG